MAAARWIEYAYLAHVSQPKAVRNLYRLVKRLEVCRIVDVGISDLDRTVSLIRVAQRYAGANPVTYTGLDWFDARPTGRIPLTLKEAHRMLRRTGAGVRLVPGEPARSLAAVANALQHTGLLLIDSTVTDSSLAHCWFFVPRMLDETSIVLREQCSAAGEPAFRRVSAAELAKYASQAAARRAA